MRRLLTSLYGKISLIFLLLLAVFGGVQVLLSTHASMRFVQESDQRLHKTLAADLAQTFKPFLADSLDSGAIEHTLHELMVMNPRVESYILDDAGNLLAYFAPPEAIKRMAVDLHPIREFLTPGAGERMPIHGDDPRSADRQKPFAAAPILIGRDRQPGFVYVILGGEEYDSAAEMIRQSYILRMSAIGLAVTFLFTAIIGLVLFSQVTRRLGALTSVVQQFDEGELARRARVTSGDEIGRLGSAFNRMADRIGSQMQALQETDRLRRDLIANVSHDLRTPLASMQGYVETILMKEDTLTAEERRRYLQTITQNVKKLGKLVDELFELSKLDARYTRPRPEPFAIAELVQDVAIAFRPQAERHELELRTEMPPDLPPVRADIAMIERALSNLLQNAIDYTPRGGQVTIGLSAKDGKVRVRVSDTGVGIPADELPRIFDRLYRVDRSRSRATGGAGLGLAIAAKIVEANGARIVVESAPGDGATFSFDLEAAVAR